MGRPTNEPKPNRIVVRISDQQKELLNEYCEQKQVNKMQAIRNGIDKLKEDIKK